MRRCGSLPKLLVIACCVLPLESAEGGLTVSQAIETALAHQPSIQAAKTRIEAAAGLRRQAELHPNPQLTLQAENLRFTGTPAFHAGDDLDAFVFLSQSLERGGKRLRRIEVAEGERKVAEGELAQVQWRVRQEVRRAFLRALQAQNLHAIVEEIGGNFQQIVDYHRVRVEQGAIAEADLLKVLLEQDRLRIDEANSLLEAERSRLELARAMGIEWQTLPPRLLDFAPAPPQGNPLRASDLLPMARDRRPDLRLSRALIELAQSQAEQQKSLARQDWDVSFGYKRAAGFDTLIGGITIPIPVFNRNEGNIQASLADVERARVVSHSLEMSAASEIGAALSRIRRYHAILDQLENRQKERAEEFWRISLAAYQEGGADLLRFLDAQRVRNDVQMVLVRTRMEYRLSLCDLEAAVGEENLALSEDLFREQP